MQRKLLKSGVELAFSVLVLLATSVSASAYWPYFSTFGGWYGGGEYYSTYAQESVPYYALNPPVYYSYPVARTYGLYPFPYYADVANCPSVAPEPLLVVNRFVDQKQTAESGPISRQPLRITNPFVEQAADSDSVKQASWEESKAVKPKVVYPIKVTST
jgi:hypothetical protein